MIEKNKSASQDLSAHEKEFITSIKNDVKQHKQGYCRCTNCGYTEPKEFLVPCHHKRCPRCESPLVES